tara:strand:+ start:567 stop:746 length:180 start_codon:yes stop_codon:yes gene_type:complete
MEKDDIKHMAYAVLLGILISVGMHLADWAIPDPVIKVSHTTKYMVCINNEECEFINKAG